MSRAPTRRRGERISPARSARAPYPCPSGWWTSMRRSTSGGRLVELRHLGRGYTGHGLVVVVPDGNVVFAGRPRRGGRAAAVQGRLPREWPGTLDVLLAKTTATVVVPGHGDAVGRDFVSTQREALRRLVHRSADGHAAGAGGGDVASTLPELGDFAVQAVQRTYWQLERDEAPQ